MVETFGAGKIFRESLSRVGIDLIDHLNSLQHDPSKIPGAFCFESSTADSDDSLHSSPQDPGSQYQSMERSMHPNKLDEVIVEHHDAKDFSRTPQHSLLVQEMGTMNCFERSQGSPVCWENFCRGEDLWDDISWSTGMVKSCPRGECVQSIGHGDTERAQPESPCLQETGSMISSEKRCLSTLEEPLYTGDNCWDNFSWSTGLAMTGAKYGDKPSALMKENHDCGMTHSFNFTADGNNGLLDDMIVEMHDSSTQGETRRVSQTRCLSSDSLQSSIVNDEAVPMEMTNQDDALTNIEEEERLAIDDSNVSCVSSERASDQQAFPSGGIGLIRDSRNQSSQGQRKRCHLDELITGAVIAECELQQKACSHYDLDTLSQRLSAYMASIFKEQTPKQIFLKDLVVACSCAQDVTLQRYFAALLSSTHQQNMGNWKDCTMEGHQILLQHGVSGKLCDVTISILSSVDFP